METVLANEPPYYFRLFKRLTYNFGEPIDLSGIMEKLRANPVSEEEARKIITDKIQDEMMVSEEGFLFSIEITYTLNRLLLDFESQDRVSALQTFEGNMMVLRKYNAVLISFILYQIKTLTNNSNVRVIDKF